MIQKSLNVLLAITLLGAFGFVVATLMTIIAAVAG